MHCLLCHNKCSELDFEQDHLPGPKDRVTISCLQLHLRVPFAGFITGLLWVICKQNGGVTGTGTAVDKKTCVQSASSINTDLNEVAHVIEVTCNLSPELTSASPDEHPAKSICQASRAVLEREKLWSESPLHSERNVRTGPTPSSGRRLHMTCVMSRCLFSCHLPSQISPSVQPW